MAGFNRRDVIKLESRTKGIHCFTKAYEYLLEAKTPSISEDFKAAWPTVLNAIKQVQRTGRAQELFITGKSVSYKNYEPQGDIKMKVTVKQHEGEDEGAVYSRTTSNALSEPVNHGIINVERFINPDAIFRDFYDRLSKAMGDTEKVSALKKGLMNKLKRYGAPASWLKIVQRYVDTLIDKSGSNVSFVDMIIRTIAGFRIDADNLDDAIRMLDIKLAQEGVLARGEIKIYTRPGISDTEYKSIFIHELTHAFDPKAHLPHRTRDKNDKKGSEYYSIDPLELDASLNQFGTIAKELPDEFNSAVKNIIKRGQIGDYTSREFDKLISKYKGRVNESTLLLYQENLYHLYTRIKKLSDEAKVGLNLFRTRDGSIDKSQNKFFLKLMNILDDPKEAMNRSLQDRLSSYKDSKKRNESQGFENSPIPPAPVTPAPAPPAPAPPAPAPSASAPSNNATPGAVDDSLLQEVLRETFGATNGAYNYGRMAYGDRRITPQNSAFKPYPEVLAMCKNIIQRGVAGLSAAEAKQVVYLVAFIMVQKGSNLAFHLGRLLNLKTIARVDGGLFARFVKVAIEMEF
jgi:hypothetical protein